MNIFQKGCMTAALCAALIPSSAFALKVNTHVWVAQQIIEDLEDGELTIYVDGDPVNVAINPQLQSYILEHQKEFRAGSLGPDAFPDVILGQVSIHPGAKDRSSTSNKTWNTDDWLSYIVENAEHPPEKAFAYGNLVHAASDVFAHSYVNMYAGEVFDIIEHIDVSTLPDRRHFLLESYIGSMTPNLSDNLAFDDAVAFLDTKKYVDERNAFLRQLCEIENAQENLGLDCGVLGTFPPNVTLIATAHD